MPLVSRRRERRASLEDKRLLDARAIEHASRALEILPSLQ
jgi:hypothetical protein